MRPANLPQIDSVKELAKFWDTHDLTDFDDEFEEVAEPVFVRKTSLADDRNTSRSALDEQIASEAPLPPPALDSGVKPRSMEEFLPQRRCRLRPWSRA